MKPKQYLTMEDLFLNKRSYETPEMKVIYMTAEDFILNISYLDGPPTD